MRRLVESWLRAEKEQFGNNTAAALRRMNDKRQVHLTHSRVSEWRRGIYTPSPVMLSQMLFRMLPWALKAAGIDATSRQIVELERLIWVFVENDGQTQVQLL